MSQRFPSSPERLSDIRRFLMGHAAGTDLPEIVWEDMILAVSEVCSNVMRHTDGTHLDIRLDVSGGRVEIEVEDSGVFRPGLGHPTRVGGMGLPMVMALMDEVTIRAGTRARPGTVVRMTKYVR